MRATKFAVAVIVLLHMCSAHVQYIGCDLTIKTGKPNAGQNIMTTTANVMGSAPSSGTLATASTLTYSSGSTVSFTFASPGNSALFHVTHGTFTGGTSAWTTTTQGNACTGTQAMLLKPGNTNTGVV